jgi:hypothetical protein
MPDGEVEIMRSVIASSKAGALAAFGMLILAAAPAAAHHSFDAEYDATKTANVTGVVTKVEWVNPHAHIFLDVKGKDGTVENFELELGPPYALVRSGWKRDTVKIGDTITIEKAALAKNGSAHAGSTHDTTLITSTGQRMVTR